MSAPRQHPVEWISCVPGKRYVLGVALGIDARRISEADALVQAMVSRNASVRKIVSVLAEREMTDAEFAVAMYALGWFDCVVRGPESDGEK